MSSAQPESNSVFFEVFLTVPSACWGKKSRKKSAGDSKGWPWALIQQEIWQHEYLSADTYFSLTLPISNWCCTADWQMDPKDSWMSQNSWLMSKSLLKHHNLFLVYLFIMLLIRKLNLGKFGAFESRLIPASHPLPKNSDICKVTIFFRRSHACFVSLPTWSQENVKYVFFISFTLPCLMKVIGHHCGTVLCEISRLGWSALVGESIEATRMFLKCHWMSQPWGPADLCSRELCSSYKTPLLILKRSIYPYLVVWYRLFGRYKVSWESLQWWQLDLVIAAQTRVKLTLHCE